MKEQPGKLSLTINTVTAYRDHTGTYIDPQAGISFIWLAGEKTAKVAGITYIRKQHFLADLGLTIPHDDFFRIQRTVMAATAPAARMNTKLPGR